MNYAIDTHCHLSFVPKWIQGKVIERAKNAGVKKLITVACNLKEVRESLSIAGKYDFIWTTAGIHPTDLSGHMERDLERVKEYAKNEKKVVAIGEIGLDYYHDRFPHDQQIEFLRGQLEIAEELGLPAVLHARAGKFSFTGIVTYERNEELREIIRDMPLDSMMIETDAPFLPPKKYKGRKNEPAYVIEVAKTIASVREMSLDEVLSVTSENAERFFGI
jgi:TatD DNase family protein